MSPDVPLNPLPMMRARLLRNALTHAVLTAGCLVVGGIFSVPGFYPPGDSFGSQLASLLAAYFPPLAYCVAFLTGAFAVGYAVAYWIATHKPRE